MRAEFGTYFTHKQRVRGCIETREDENKIKTDVETRFVWMIKKCVLIVALPLDFPSMH